jgi:hypothetical protein
LKLGQPDFDIRHSLADNNLARQARIFGSVGPQSQHRGFLGVGGSKLTGYLNKTVAGATNSTAAAIRVYTRDIVL